jgi:hypothetical protein
MLEIPLNKFQKQDLVITLRRKGHVYRDIAHLARVSVRDIKPILKAHEKKIKLQTKKENNQETTTTKKLSFSSQAFTLFKEGKKPTDVAIILDISYKQVSKYWYQFLKLEKKFDCYEFYEVFQYDLPTLLPISNFMKRNNVSGSNIVPILRTATEIPKLNEIYLNLKTEIKYLEQRRSYLSYSPSSPYSLQPLPPNNPKDNYYQ